MTMTDERTAVAAFLRKCNEYAKASIERKQARGELDEISRWEAYIEFNEHALEEIANGTLDRWFQPTTSHQPPLLRLDVNAMEHVERSTWLNSVLSPAPWWSLAPSMMLETEISHRFLRSCRSPPHRRT